MTLRQRTGQWASHASRTLAPRAVAVLCALLASHISAGAADPTVDTSSRLILAQAAPAQSLAPTTAEPAPTSTTPASSPPLPVVTAEPPSEEAQYMARLDALIAPVRDFSPTADDIKRLQEAIKGAADQANAKALRMRIEDPAARKLAEWLAFKGGAGDAAEIQAFVEANPAWGDRTLLVRRAEEQLLASGGSAQKIKAFFKGQEPKTGAGLAALASAALAEKDEVKAREYAAKAWREHELAASFETGFIERFKAYLGEADHKRRLDRILVDEVRFSGERAERAAFARRVIPLLSEAERAKAEARLAIFLRAKLAAQLYAALPAEPEGTTDWGLAFQRVQHLRRSGQADAAIKILLSAPTDPELITSPDDWWSERRAAAYDALRAGQHQTAYDLVKAAGPLTVNPLKEQTFMAGWIAMRHLKKADVALKHFDASRAAADGPLSRARADYWAGRALETLGRGDAAKLRYKAATADIDTFHGQLALHKIASASAQKLSIPMPALPSTEEARRFAELDAVRAAVVVSKAGLDRNILRALFGHLRNHLKTEAEMAMLAHLAGALGDPQTALRVGKTGIARGMNMIVYAYPLHAFPSYTPLREPPEPALLLAVARQETEFNNAIISTAGARGLLQVMPVTAAHICRDYKIKCDIPRLNTDNSYNAMIASAYIADRMGEFKGDYVLSLAGYNAGPGRARQWIREYGDPRDTGIDPIDWIESIPIEETREYVKKVLSNIQIYRARLGETAPVRLAADLRRPPTSRRAAASPAPPATKDASAN